MFSYEPHLFHFLKTDFPILVGVNARKGFFQGSRHLAHERLKLLHVQCTVASTSRDFITLTRFRGFFEYRQCPLFWRSLRQFGRQGPLWQSAIFSMMGWLSIGLAPYYWKLGPGNWLPLWRSPLVQPKLSQISPHNVPSFKTWKYHNEKEISENFVCLLCPMYVTSLIRNARTGLASSLLKEFPMSAIWCRMWKYENVDTFCNPNIFTGNCHCDNFDILKEYLPLNFMHVSICVFIFQLGRSILTFPQLDQRK